MDIRPENRKAVERLLEKGVSIPNPLSVHVGGEVKLSRISGSGVTIYPGCRIRGEETVIGPGAQIGREGPATVENCQVGPRVELKGGYFRGSVFLERSSMGLGAHVREGCILEEQASGAHCVGLKQTILFPFVTLGSLINFCDCLMAGGTSRKNHSEVGSSYIHFNFTADGDKATASLFGDVPRGVMLNQPPIFLGGQGGAVGPLRMGYGNVVIAGTVLRKDVPETGRMIIGKSFRGGTIPFVPGLYRGLSRTVENNILYLANMAALEQWYVHVRSMTLRTLELGDLLHEGALHKIGLAREERIRRLRDVALRMPDSLEGEGEKKGRRAGMGRVEFGRNFNLVEELFRPGTGADMGLEHRDPFLEEIRKRTEYDGPDHVTLIQALPPEISKKGTLWLQEIVDGLCRKTAGILPAMGLFRK